MAMATLVLRDVHVPPAPAWWPPAAGWWWVAGACLLALAAVVAWRLLRARRRRCWLRWFDDAMRMPSPADQLAAMSELLRRAARRQDARADRLAGEEWLRFLDGRQGRAFTDGPGRLLLDGGYRRGVDAAQVRAAAEVARARFLQLMEARR